MPTSKPQRNIDWEAVWQSLNWDDETRNTIAERTRLHQRAQQYAAPPREAKSADEEGLTVLTFELGSEQYGVDVMTVRGVRSMSRIARVPGIPNFYRGVVNLRGQILTVLDLRLFFDIPVNDEMSTPDELVTVRANNLEIGLMAHLVNGVMTIPHEYIGSADHIRYALGVTAHGLVILNIPQMFEDDRLIVGGKDE
jgi:purine-binding chemotaxis protein CheW